MAAKQTSINPDHAAQQATPFSEHRLRRTPVFASPGQSSVICCYSFRPLRDGCSMPAGVSGNRPRRAGCRRTPATNLQRSTGRNQHILGDPLAGLDRECGAAAIPVEIIQLPIVRIDETNQIAQHDAGLCPKPERGSIARIAGVADGTAMLVPDQR